MKKIKDDYFDKFNLEFAGKYLPTPTVKVESIGLLDSYLHLKSYKNVIDLLNYQEFKLVIVFL